MGIFVKNVFIAGLNLRKVGANRVGAPVLWESVNLRVSRVG